MVVWGVGSLGFLGTSLAVGVVSGFVTCAVKGVGRRRREVEMPIFTIIGRMSDGLTLAASMASQSDPDMKNVQRFERQAKQLLSSLARKNPGQDDHTNPIQDPNAAPSPYVTAETDPQFCFHYVSDAGVCFLTLTEKHYPRR